MRFPARIAYTLLTGYILAYFSEWMFWSGRPPAENFLLDALPTWLAYSFITFLFLSAARYFRAQNVWAVFLIGALYGWLLEGVLVQTMYDTFPLQISFTALSWHALLSVMFGWYMLPRLLRRSRAILACILFGLALGLWSVGWWLEPDVAVAPFGQVFIYNIAFGLLLLPAYVLHDRFDLADFNPTRIEIRGAILLLLLYFALVTLPQQPLALLVLPPLLALVLWTLRKNRQREPDLQPSPAKIRFRGALPLLLIPLTASLVYGLAQSINLRFPSLQIVYVITMPLGFIALAVSLYKVGKGRQSVQAD